jgi:hypothetical protein
VGEPRNPSLPKMREWPMFRLRERQPHRARSTALDGRPLPRIADLIMAHVAGTPLQKLAWLHEQKTAGKLDGDDPEEIAQAEALLVMLARLLGSKGQDKKRHLDELLDEGLKGTFPASDPVSVGHFTGTEAPSRPIDSGVADVSRVRKPRGKTQRRRRRAA